ncbi:MAG: MarR family transcriptional regulator [Pseudomonadota bacterium]
MSTETDSADNATDRLQLDRFLPYRLSVLTNLVSRTMAARYAERYNLTTPEWRVIAVIGRLPGLSAIEVAERTQMDKVAVSRAVARLLKSGRLAREFTDTDKRRSMLSLTEAGANVHSQVSSLALEFEASLLETLSEADKSALDELLSRLWERARALAKTSD